MDQRMRPVDTDTTDANVRTLSRRTFFTWARLGLVAAAGVAVFGVSNPIVATAAKESADEDSKEKARDKDGEAKEKEKEAKNKEKDQGPAKSKKNKNKNKDKNKNKPSDPNAPSPYGKYIVPGQDKYNCTDFVNQHDAQAVLRLDPKDPNNLDKNRDGIACGGNEAFQDGVPGGFMMPPYDIKPVPRP